MTRNVREVLANGRGASNAAPAGEREDPILDRCRLFGGAFRPEGTKTERSESKPEERHPEPAEQRRPGDAATDDRPPATVERDDLTGVIHDQHVEPVETRRPDEIAVLRRAVVESLVGDAEPRGCECGRLLQRRPAAGERFHF